jgi:hypothetical protein
MWCEANCELVHSIDLEAIKIQSRGVTAANQQNVLKITIIVTAAQ